MRPSPTLTWAAAGCYCLGETGKAVQTSKAGDGHRGSWIGCHPAQLVIARDGADQGSITMNGAGPLSGFRTARLHCEGWEERRPLGRDGIGGAATARDLPREAGDASASGLCGLPFSALAPRWTSRESLWRACKGARRKACRGRRRWRWRQFNSSTAVPRYNALAAMPLVGIWGFRGR